MRKNLSAYLEYVKFRLEKFCLYPCFLAVRQKVPDQPQAPDIYTEQFSLIFPLSIRTGRIFWRCKNPALQKLVRIFRGLVISVFRIAAIM